MRQILAHAVVLAAVVITPTPSVAVTREPAEHEPGIIQIASDAESIFVYRVDSDSIPRCDWDFTDSLRFTHCYPILEEGSAPGRDWREDLGDLLGTSSMVRWN